MTDITSPHHVKSHVLETARQYDIEVIATEIGTSRNHQILSALGDLGLQVKTVNAALYGFELTPDPYRHDLFAPDADTDVIVVDELSTLGQSALPKAISSVLTHAATVPFILSESINNAQSTESILHNLRPLFENTTVTVRSNI